MSIICNPLFLYVYNMNLILSIFVSCVPYISLIFIRLTIIIFSTICTIPFLYVYNVHRTISLCLLCVHALFLCVLCESYPLFIWIMWTIHFVYMFYVYRTHSLRVLRVPYPFSKCIVRTVPFLENFTVLWTRKRKKILAKERWYLITSEYNCYL